VNQIVDILTPSTVNLVVVGDQSLHTDTCSRNGAKLKHGKRTNSCPPGRTRSVVSGSWSLAWLCDHNYRDAGVIFLSRKGLKNKVQLSQVQQVNKKETINVLRHLVLILKKVAGMPTKDIKVNLKEFKKQVYKCHGGSINNRLKVSVGSESS
jgi:hypothetical protein